MAMLGNEVFMQHELHQRVHFEFGKVTDGLPMLRDGMTGDWIGTFSGHKGAVWDAALNAHATHAFTASADFSAKVWDAFNGECILTFNQDHIVRASHVSPDSVLMAAGGFDKRLRVHDLNKPEADPISTGFNSPIRAARFVNAGRSLAISLGGNKAVYMVDPRSLEVVAIPLDFEPDSFNLSHDGSRISTAGERAASLIDAHSMSVIQTLHLSHEVEAAALLSSSQRLATGGKDSAVHLVDPSDGSDLGQCASSLLRGEERSNNGSFGLAFAQA